MPKLEILKGLQGSGKSTYARSLVDAHPNSYKRINKDDLRAMLDNSNFTKKSEEFILKARDTLILLALQDNKNVVIDDTNLNPKHETHLRNLVKDLKNVTVVVNDIFLQVPLEECIKRDLKRLNSVGKDVIMENYNKYLKKPVEAIKVPYDDNLPTIIISDLDGTLATMKDRSPFDWKKVGQDLLNVPVSETIKALQKNYGVIYVSGRSDECRKETEDWLEANGHGNYISLFMRKSGDNRKDTIVKEEIYKEHIEGKYNVLLVLDDRRCVIQDTWRKLGIDTFEVNDHDF